MAGRHRLVRSVASYFPGHRRPRYLRHDRAFGPFVGFQAGWLLTLSRAAAFAANAHLMVTYAGWFWPPLVERWRLAPRRGGRMVCVALTAINVMVGVPPGHDGPVRPDRALKLLPLLLTRVPRHFSQTNPRDIHRRCRFRRLIPWATRHAHPVLRLRRLRKRRSFPAGEARSPRRDIPKGPGAQPSSPWHGFLLPDPGGHHISSTGHRRQQDPAGRSRPDPDGVTAGAAILTLGAVFSITGNLTSTMLSAPRMLYAMSRHDGSLPAVVCDCSSIRATSTPANAILFYAPVCHRYWP